jgi:glycogen debranching enzyme
LPEAFAGFDRSIGPFPVPYPTACSPQAWATGAPFAFLRAVLGLDARDGELIVDPMIPPSLGGIAIHGIRALGARWDIDASGAEGHARLAAEGGLS